MRLFRKKRKRDPEEKYRLALAAGEPIFYRGIRVPVSADVMPIPVLVALDLDSYEEPELEAASALMQPGDRMLELGTGLGIVSSVLGKQFPDCQIVSYEANPVLIPHIHALHQANGITNVAVHNRLLEPNPQVESRPFHIHSYFTEGSIKQTAQSLKAIEVPVEDLNTVIKKFDPTIVMCDVEGAEELVIPQADLENVRALVLEFHPKLLSRTAVKSIFDSCAKHGLYPCIEHSSQQVIAFERVE